MKPDVHIYAVKGQPATRYCDMTMDRPMWFINSPRKRLVCHTCWKARQARNIRVQVYYDKYTFSCAPGKGCALLKPKRRKGRA